MAFLRKLKTETISEFRQRLRPTETSQSTGAWIWCSNERHQDAEKAPRPVEAKEQGDDSELVRIDLTETSEIDLSPKKGDHGEPVLIDLTGDSESDLSDSEIYDGSDLSDSEVDDDSKRAARKRAAVKRTAEKRGTAILDELVKDLCDTKGRTKKSLREDAVEALKQVAIKYGQTCGKWMIFPKLTEVDDMWAIVAEATVEGRLGHGAKVGTCKEEITTLPPSTAKVICVYTPDFQKIDKLKQILESLEELGVPPISFKLDLFTYLNIGTETKSLYGLQSGIYTPKSIREIAVGTPVTPTPQAGSRKRKPVTDLTSFPNDSD